MQMTAWQVHFAGDSRQTSRWMVDFTREIRGSALFVPRVLQEGPPQILGDQRQITVLVMPRPGADFDTARAALDDITARLQRKHSRGRRQPPPWA